MTPAQPRSYVRAERLLEMGRLFTAGPLGSRAVLERLNLPLSMLRTVQRDLELLCDRGDLERLESGLYQQSESRRSRAGFNTLEAVAVYSLARVFYQQAPEYSGAFEGVMRHLSRNLPDALQVVLSQARARYGALRRRPDLPSAYLKDASRTLEKVAEAWLAQRYLHFQYRSSSAQASKAVQLALFAVEVNPQNHLAYAIGRDRLASHGEVRVYRVGRMERAEVGKDAFIVPPDFDLHTFFEHAWGVMRSDTPVTVLLDFAPEATERVLESRVPCLVRSPTPLTSGGLRLELRVGHPLELEPWIRGWGSLVEVIEPPDLRERIRLELQRTLERYIPSAGSAL